MSKITISKTKDHFIREGKPWFYLADTVWSAFTNATEKEWEAYLDYRAEQRFNTLQINILPQHDRSDSANDMLPFDTGKDGRYDFRKPRREYFDRAAKYCEMAVKKGFTLALVVLWFDYIEDRWRREKPHRSFKAAEISPWVQFAVSTFRKFSPIYIVSGDCNFARDWSKHPKEGYLTAFKFIKKLDPAALTTMHLQGGAYPPKVFLEHMDFYIYQSGHMRDGQHLPYEQAANLCKYRPKRPVLNAEPCYEGHPFGGEETGRWSAFDVRKAIWSSMLSGAKAGVSYGAHGIWSWHQRGRNFRGWNFSKQPFPWRVALKFPGAWDVALARMLFEGHGLVGIEPAQKLLVNKTEDIRVAMSKDKSRLVVYAPYAWAAELKEDLSKYDWAGIALATRESFVPLVKRKGKNSVIEMDDFNSDVVIIGQK